MSEAKHTPGKWYVPDTERFMVDAVIPGKSKADHDYRIAKTYASPYAPNMKEAEANARLIAAAPELLEAVEEAVERLEASDHPADQRFRERLIELIAKAKGGAT